MPQRTGSAKLYDRILCFVLFFLAAAASFNGYYDKWQLRESTTERIFPHSIDRMLDGTAERPYVYRQLLPDFANWVDKHVSKSITDRWNAPRGPHAIAEVDDFFETSMARNRVYSFRYLVVYVTAFLFALLAVFAMYLVCRALEIPQAAAVMAPIAVILLIPYLQSIGGYYYDYPELAFLSLAVWVALKFDWWWIIPIAALGTWNKESFLLVIPTLYPILRQRISRLGALIGCGILCLVSGTVFIATRIRFAHNPGGGLLKEWPKQLDSLLHPRLLIYGVWPFEKTYGLLLPPVYTLLPMAILIWTIWRGWRYLPVAIQRHGQIAAAINIPLYFLFCAPGELRDFSLLYVVLFLVLAANLNRSFGGSATARTSPASTVADCP